MSSNHRLMELGGAWSVRVPACCCLGEWEGHSEMISAIEGPRRVSMVFSMHGFSPMPGVWGPSWACITSDRCDLLSRFLFVDTWVESKLLSNCTWRAGESSFSDRVVWLLEGNFAFSGKDASSVRLEAIHWLWGYRHWEGPIYDFWARNSSFSSLSHLVWRSRDCICRSLLCGRLSILSRQAK